MPYFENLCDQLDAAVFSGDSLEDPKNRTLFAEHLGRWQRRLAEHDVRDPYRNARNGLYGPEVAAQIPDEAET